MKSNSILSRWTELFV